MTLEKEKPVVTGTMWIEETSLPLPWVLYPGYGWWIAFAEAQNSQPYFCACMRPAFEAWLTANLKSGAHRLIPGEKNLLNHFLPNAPSTGQYRIEQPSEVHESPIFRADICHLCTQHVPSVRQCPDAYGHTIIEQHFGWYLESAGLELGKPATFESGKDKLIIASEAKYTVLNKLGISEGLTSEALLYLCVRGSFPDEAIKRRYRHPALNNKELDIWLPERRLGIEYQGEQHFRPVAPFGGREGHEATVRRDEEKRQSCKELSIHLEEFTATDPLTENWIQERLLRYWYDPEKKMPEVRIPKIKNRPSGPEWEVLNGKQQLDVLIQIWMMEEMDWKVGHWGQSQTQASEEVCAEALRFWGKENSRNHGISQVSIDRKYSRWKKRGNLAKWQDSIRFSGLQKDKGAALRDEGLTPELARNFFKQIPGGLTRWAESRGFSPYAVNNCVDRNRTGKHDKEIARAIRLSLEQLRHDILKERDKIKERISKDQTKLKKLESRIAKLGRPLS